MRLVEVINRWIRGEAEEPAQTISYEFFVNAAGVRTLYTDTQQRVSNRILLLAFEAFCKAETNRKLAQGFYQIQYNPDLQTFSDLKRVE